MIEFFNWSMLFVIIAAYLFGSIPTAVLVGKWFYKVDVREYGSGNAGATNTIRVLGPVAAIPVFVIDLMKGFSAVELTYACKSSFHEHNEIFALFKVIISMIVVLGHVFPVFAGFRGGKGIATSLGVVLALFPYSAIITTVIFIIALLISHYVSLSSIISAFIFPFVNIFVFDIREWAYLIFAIVLSAFAIFSHRKNIRRLIKGEEAKFFFKKKIPIIRN